MEPSFNPRLNEYLEKIKDYEHLSLESLDRNNLLFLQLEDSFRYGNEQVLLAHFASELLSLKEKKDLENKRKSFKLLDPGAGSGILTVLSSALIPNSRGLAIELMDRPFKVLEANLKINQLNQRFQALHKDIRELLKKELEKKSSLSNSFDLAIANPPYFETDTGPKRKMDTEASKEIAAAKEEIYITLEEYIHFISLLLKDQARVALVSRSERLIATINYLSKYNLQPYLLRGIQNTKASKIHAFLIAAKKNGKTTFTWEKNLLIYNEKGAYTEEVRKFYEE